VAQLALNTAYTTYKHYKQHSCTCSFVHTLVLS